MQSRHFLFLTLSLLTMGRASGVSAKVIYEDDEVTVVESRVPIKGEIKSAIAHEMDKARKDESYDADVAGIAARMNEAFPFLDDYLHDPNPNVRANVVWILESERSQRSLSLISRFLDKDTGETMGEIQYIWKNYTPTQIRQWGGERLQRVTFESAKGYPQHFATFVLSAFGTKAKPQLEVLRRLNPQTKEGFLESYFTEPVRVTFACDLALAQIGDASSLGRVKERLALGSLNDKAFILDASQSFDSKPLLRLMLEMLNDKREQRPLPHYGNGPQLYTRICDIAWAAFQVKLGKRVWMEHQPKPQTDAVLKTIAVAIKKKFAL